MGTLNTAAQNSLIDGITGDYTTLDIRASDDTVLVSFSISFNAASGGSADVSGTPITSAASATGTAAKARLTGAGSEEITGIGVGTSGAEINLNTLEIESGKDVDLESYSLTSPTSTT